jgi:hypothetical protein
MDTTSYKQTLASARRDLDRLLRERDEIDTKISKLETAVDSLSALCGEPIVADPYTAESETYASNLRHEIRLVFNAARPNALTPTEVRDRLRENGFPLERYKNALPPIHNTIARLQAAGEIELALKPGGEKAYRFVGIFARAAKRVQEERERNLSSRAHVPHPKRSFGATNSIASMSADGRLKDFERDK